MSAQDLYKPEKLTPFDLIYYAYRYLHNDLISLEEALKEGKYHGFEFKCAMRLLIKTKYHMSALERLADMCDLADFRAWLKVATRGGD